MLLDSSINWSFCHISIFEISNIQINLCPAGNDSSSSCASFVVDPFSYNFFVFMIVTNVSFCWNFLVLWFHMNLQPNHVFFNGILLGCVTQHTEKEISHNCRKKVPPILEKFPMFSVKFSGQNFLTLGQ